METHELEETAITQKYTSCAGRLNVIFTLGKIKVVPVQNIKHVVELGAITPLIFNRGARWGTPATLRPRHRIPVPTE